MTSILTKARIYMALRKKYAPSSLQWRGNTLYFLAHGAYAHKAVINSSNTLSIFRITVNENMLIERIEL